MKFATEDSFYYKTILSDFQGTWNILRESVVESAGFNAWERVLFHIDEAMSWESVRNLQKMKPLLLVIRNLCMTGNAPKEVLENIENVTDIYDEIQDRTSKGEQI